MFSFNEDRAAGWMAGRMMPAADYLTAQRIRSRLTREADEIVSRYDAVIAPTWPNGAALREVSEGWPIPARNEWEPPDDIDTQTPRLNYIANLVGHPGLNVPCGFEPGRTTALSPDRGIALRRPGRARLRDVLPAGHGLALGAPSLPLD